MSANDPCTRIVDDASAIAAALTLPGRDADEAQFVDAAVASVRGWAGERLDDAAIDHAGLIPPALLQEAAELGLFGLTAPPQWGGSGLSMVATCRLVEELATFDRSVATAIGLHNGLGLRGLNHHASEALRDRYLPAAVSGESIAAFAATEPGAGSHIASLTTTGRALDDGRIQLDGQKIYVTNGGFARIFTIMARTPGLGGARKGWSLFLVERDDPGVTVGREEVKLGIKASSTTTLTLDGVVVPASRVIGEPSRGMDGFHEILSWGRTLMSAGCLGTARRAMQLAVDYARTRHQFGKPIGSFGQIREKLARMQADLFVTESLVRLVALLKDRDGADIGWESSVLKIYASEVACRVADEALQVHGGAGFIEETGVARLLRDSRITRIFEGANEVLRFNLASLSVTAKPEDHRSSLGGQMPAALEAHAQRYEALTTSVLGAAAELRGHYGIRAFDHQVLLRGLANAQIARLGYLAAVLRTAGDLRRGLPERAATQRLQLLELIGRVAERQVARGLARTQREPEEALVTAITDALYGA